MKGKAQVSVEYIMITSFAILVAAIIFGVAFFSFNENAKVAQASEAVKKIANYADLAASLGEGSRIAFEVNLPNDVDSLCFGERSVNMKVRSGAGLSDVYANTKVKVGTSACLDSTFGRKPLAAVFRNGIVVVS